MQRQESESEEQWNLSQIRPRPSRLNAKPIGSVVRRLMAQSGYGQTQANEQLASHWKHAVGETLASLTRPGKISRGILLVHAADSATMQELVFQKRQIVSALQRAMPESKLTDIRARIGPIA